MNLFNLFAKIVMDDSEFTSGINRAQQGISSFATSTSNASSDINNFSSSTSSIGTALSGLGSESDRASNGFNSLGGNAQKMKDKFYGMSEEGIKATQTLYSMQREVQRTTRAYGTHSQQAAQARNAISEFALGLDDATFKQVYMKGQLGLTDTALQQQANSMKLSARMAKLTGDQTKILTERMAGLQRHGVKPEDLLPASTPGQFKILSETVATSGRGIYNLSSGFRTLGGAVEKNIKSWSLQKMVIKEANGDMVKYGLLMRGATAALGTMTMAFPVLAGAAGLFYGKLVSGAIEGNESLQKLAETVKGKFSKAFEPMMEIVEGVVEAVLKFGGAIADLMIKFNEAHPITAKFIQGLALLAPAMTILFLPLSMGLGLLNGWKVAINALWTIIGPFVTLIGTASSTFLVLAGVLSVVVLGLTTLWQTNETFRNMVTTAWNSIKQVATDVFGTLVTYFTETLPNAYNQGGIQAVFQNLTNVFTTALNTIKTKLPEFLQAGIEVLTNIINGIIQKLPEVLTKGTEIVTNIMDGITQMIPPLVELAATLIEAWLTNITNNFPIILEAGINILNNLIDGIINMLPSLIDTAIKLMTTIVETISSNLPRIIDAGLRILLAVVTAIINNLPKLIDAAVKMIVTIVTAIAQNLPKIIEAGVKIIKAVAKAIIDNLPTILDAGKQIISSIVSGIQSVIESVVNIGQSIVKKVWSGISGMGGWLAGKVSNFFSGIFNNAKNAFGDKAKSASRSAAPRSIRSFVDNINTDPNNNLVNNPKNNGVVVNQTIYSRDVLSPQQIAQETKNTIVRSRWKLA